MEEFEIVYSKKDGFSKREIKFFNGKLDTSEVRVRPKRIGICGSDQFYINKYEGDDLLLGHEWVGEVVESKSKQFNIGDIVTSCAVFGCGKCKNCLNELENKCLDNIVLGSEVIGMLRTSVVLNEKNLLKITKTTWNSAALIEVAAIGDAVISNMKKMGVSESDEVLIIGAGSVGVMSALSAKRQNIKYRIIESEPARIKIGNELGLNISSLGEVLLKKEKFKYIADCTGDSNEKTGGLKYYTSLIVPGASILVVGHYEKNWNFDSHLMGKFSLTLKWMKGMTKSFYMSSIKNWNDVLPTIEDRLVAKVFDIKNVAQAFEYAEKRSNGLKTIISVNE